jgi:tetratricopeptide (TPR) repeat protein
VTGFSTNEVARICRLSAARLRYWERTALVQPSLSLGSEPRFSFQDLVQIRTVLALLDRGVPLRRIRRSVEGVRSRIPELGQPLGQLRVWIDGSDRVVVRHDGRLMEPDGQVVLDFALAPPSAEDVAPLPHPSTRAGGSSEGPDPETALEWFERGCQLDSEPRTALEAIEAYQRAIAADPTFADAHCNLGTVHYNQGRRDEARACYQSALELDPHHVEASFNLANLSEEEGRNEMALRLYKAALRADPLYADAYLNLALLYEKLGLRRRARDPWRRYLQLDPNGAWAEVARKHLSELSG